MWESQDAAREVQGDGACTLGWGEPEAPGRTAEVGGRPPPAPPAGLGGEPPAPPCPPADTNVFYHIEGSRQALRIVFYLDSYHFSKLPSRLENGASLRLHTVLFTKGEPQGLSGAHPDGRGALHARDQPPALPLLPSFPALENVEGPPPPGSQAAEDLQQEINAQSLEKVQQYYRKLRCPHGLLGGAGSGRCHGEWA